VDMGSDDVDDVTLVVIEEHVVEVDRLIPFARRHDIDCDIVNIVLWMIMAMAE
jgi:hypothetical protein